MSDGLPYADIIIFALIAGFVLLRLRSVLGQKIGHDAENPPPPPYRKAERESNVIQRPEVITVKPVEIEKDPDMDALANLEPSLRQAISEIKAKDPEFTYVSFMKGARGAFEMVHDAFAKNDRATLKMLLSSEVLAVFESEIDQATATGRRAETTLLAVTAEELVRASLQGGRAKICVRFTSEQASVVRDASGKIVEGDPSHTEHVQDEWVFQRDITSRNPNWTIIDT